jgi:hypothetical protein
MSRLSVVSRDEEVQFLKSVVIPSFAPRLKFGCNKKQREDWMRLKAEKHLAVDKAKELIDRFSAVFTLEKAEEKLLAATSVCNICLQVNISIVCCVNDLIFYSFFKGLATARYSVDLEEGGLSLLAWGSCALQTFSSCEANH